MTAKDVMDNILNWYEDDEAWGGAACDLMEDVIVPFIESIDPDQRGRLSEWQASQRNK